MFLGSLSVGEKALQALGMRAYQARRKAQQFAAHDQQTIDHLAQHQNDSEMYISESRRAHQEVLEILRADRRSQREGDEDTAWNAQGHD
jgi:glutathione-regulated potassium-efflux system ancillary protein KefC/glutathione-regulated potassium-efflux system protein KefB